MLHGPLSARLEKQTPSAHPTPQIYPKPKENLFYKRYFHKGDKLTDPEELQRKKYREELEELKKVQRMRPKRKSTPTVSDEEKTIIKLIELLGTDKRQMIISVEKLVNIGQPAVARLRKALYYKDKQTRLGALSALRKIHAEQAVPDVQECLKDKAHEVRLEAVKTLGRFRHYDSVKKIIPLLQDSKKRVRKQTVITLGRFKRSPAAAIAIIDALENNISSVRIEAAQALGAFSSDHVIAALLKATYVDDHVIVGYAVRSLGELAAPKAHERIKFLINHENAFVAQEAQMALDNF